MPSNALVEIAKMRLKIGPGYQEPLDRKYGAATDADPLS
jgi:hypothetical protein